MLKPADPGPPGPERPIGELVHELIEQGKSYAQAELGLAKAIAAAKAAGAHRILICGSLYLAGHVLREGS